MPETSDDCLHCDINDLVRERIEGGASDLAKLAAMVAESLADIVLLASKEDRAALMADAIAHFGSMVLEKGSEIDAGGSGSTH
jgi:ABC-type tungstate transport system substrate-binding protein